MTSIEPPDAGAAAVRGPRPVRDPLRRSRPVAGGGRATAADLVVVLGAVALVVAAAVEGRRLLAAGVNIFLGFPPLLATWAPHFGPGSVAAVVIATAVVTFGPASARTWRWRPLLVAGWLAAVGWTLALALVDGYREGFAGRLATDQEYLFDVARAGPVADLLATFTERMPTDQAVHWTTHVGGHPPGAFLIFVLLDRIGLGGGAVASAVCVLVGASAAPAIAVTVRALGAEATARTVLPFAVLTPAAVWVGVSADGLFAGVLAWTVALFALACTGTGRRADLAGLGAGLLGGYTLYLSYGLVLGGLVPAAVLLCARRARAVLEAGTGIAVVVATFTAAGFWWFDGYRLVLRLYHASIALARPYGYFWWANLAAVVFVLGPAVLVGLRRLVVGRAGTPPDGLSAAARPGAFPAAARAAVPGAHPVADPACSRASRRAVAVLAAAALLAMVVADLSGLSKGEVERIWLPFAVWPVVACGLLPAASRRSWLVAQAASALAVNHLLLTVW